MGCNDSKLTSNHSAELSYILPFEETLGFKFLTIKDFDHIVHRHAHHDHIFLFQFLQIFDEFKIKYREFHEFYDNFNENNGKNILEKSYNKKKLISLGIFFCSGEFNTKIRVLFQNYDIESYKILSRDKVRELIENLVCVALVFIPRYVARKNKGKIELENYSLQLSVLINTLEENILEMIMDYNDNIIYEDFERKFNEKIPKKLFSSLKLRKYALSL